VVAVAHAIAISVWHILSKHETYKELGPDHFDRLSKEKLARSYIRRLHQLGGKVSTQPPGQEAA
jgi:hypothetical protein